MQTPNGSPLEPAVRCRGYDPRKPADQQTPWVEVDELIVATSPFEALAHGWKLLGPPVYLGGPGYAISGASVEWWFGRDVEVPT